MDVLVKFFMSHHYLALILGGWIAVATFVNAKVWPKNDKMPTWQKVLHFFFVDFPSVLASPGYKGYLGRLGVPFCSWSFSASGVPGSPSGDSNAKS